MRLIVEVVIVLIGCVRFTESHHCAGVDPAIGEGQNHYRVTVLGKAACSQTRHIAGHCDKRALDLFFKEIKTSTGTEAEFPNIFEDEEDECRTAQREIANVEILTSVDDSCVRAAVQAVAV